MLPDGYLSHDLIIFGKGFNRQTLLGRGFLLDHREIPVDEAAEESLAARLRLLLAWLGEDYALQYHWWIDADFSDLLHDYDRGTQAFLEQKRGDLRWTEFVRRERLAHYQDRLEGGYLRRERIALFITRRCTHLPPWAGLQAAEIDAFLQSMNHEFTEKGRLLTEIFPNSLVTPLDDNKHFHFYQRFLNPSRQERDHQALRDQLIHDPRLTIIENCLQSDGICLSNGRRRTDPGTGLHLAFDGLRHGFLIIREWPVRAWAGMLRPLLASLGIQTHLTQNIFPLPLSREIEKEQKEARFLQGGLRRGQTNLDAVIRRKLRKIEDLMNGSIRPFRVQTIFRLWSDDPADLRSRLLSLQTGLNHLAGARYHLAHHPGQLRHFFRDTFPGWTGNPLRGWDIYADSSYLPYLMPGGGSFLGQNPPEAIYESPNRSLVGISGFRDHQPRHLLVLGMTGSGKSVWLTDYLSQSYPGIAWEGIIDEGQSLRGYAQLQKYPQAILQPDGDISLNYLDTQGAPLSSLHLNMAVGLLQKMLGHETSERERKLQAAILNRHLNQLYWDTFEDWVYRHPAQAQQILNEAWLATMAKGETEKESIQNQEREILAFSKDPQGRMHWRNRAFSCFKPADYHQATHSSLVQLLGLTRGQGETATEARKLATLLEPWTRHGEFGCLFDGISSFPWGEQGVYFELGLIPESARELKETAVFLVSTVLRQRIIGLPRTQRKRIVFEEIKRFTQAQGGARLIAEFLEQMRKFGCQTILTGQQFQQLLDAGIDTAVSQNSGAFVLFRQQGQTDIDLIGDRIGLPAEMREAITNFPLPGRKKQEAQTSACLFAPSDQPPVCGSFVCRPARELLFAAASSGPDFENRNQLFAQSSDPFSALIASTTS